MINPERVIDYPLIARLRERVEQLSQRVDQRITAQEPHDVAVPVPSARFLDEVDALLSSQLRSFCNDQVEQLLSDQ